jgi:hypothetical protein
MFIALAFIRIFVFGRKKTPFRTLPAETADKLPRQTSKGSLSRTFTIFVDELGQLGLRPRR